MTVTVLTVPDTEADEDERLMLLRIGDTAPDLDDIEPAVEPDALLLVLTAVVSEKTEEGVAVEPLDVVLILL